MVSAFLDLLLAQLIEDVFVDYARLLIGLGMRKASEYYCKEAGPKGERLLKEIETMLTG